MKKWIVLFILLVIPLAASAEVSTNLKIQTINVQNSKRLVESITYVDDEGNAVIPTDKGYATVKYTYGVGKKVAQESYLDENGNPVNCIDGYAFIKYKYSASKLIETAYYDIDNNLTTGPDGYARQVVTYQGYYRQSVWEYDPEGNPVGIHNITEYEKISGRTLVVSDSWYDAEDKLASGPNGYARVEYEYDGKNRSKTTYISSDGSLYFYKKAGFAIKETKYERSNIIAEYYYGADHELTAGPDGYAYIIYTYIKDYVKEIYYNADGSLFFNEDGVCGLCQKNNNSSSQTDVYYFVGEETRGRCNEGYSRIKTTKNIRGKIIYQAYYDENDDLMIVPELGYAQVRNEYFRGQYLTRAEYLDTDNKPIRSVNGYAVVTKKYENKKVVETAYYDIDGKTLINNTNGYAIELQQYTDGNVTSIKYQKADGTPLSNLSGTNEVRYTWIGSLKSSTSYWENDNPCVGIDGYHEVRYVYDENGRVTDESYYGENQEPVFCEKGYHRIKKIWVDNKYVCSEAWFDENDQPITLNNTYVRREREYDNAGNVIVERYYGPDGEKISCKEGYDEIRRVYNEENKAIKLSYYTDGKLTNQTKGYSVIEREYDEAGFVAVESYYGENGEAVLSASGYHKIERTWAYEDHPSSEAWYDENDQPMTLNNTYVRREREYDNAGNVIIERYYGPDGEKIPCKDGYDELRRTTEGEEVYYLNGEKYDPPGEEIPKKEIKEDNTAQTEQA